MGTRVLGAVSFRTAHHEILCGVVFKCIAV
jgi:hypothetical protein